MPRPAYLVTQTLATALQAHFANHLSAVSRENSVHATVPSTEVIVDIVDAAFWASLRREEGFVPKISLALLAPEQSPSPLRFERPLPLAAEALTRLAPAVERPGIHLGVWHEGQGLAVWGTTRTLPAYCFVLEVAAPGVLVLKHSPGEEPGKFVNVAVFEGDRIKIIAQDANGSPEGQDLMGALFGIGQPPPQSPAVNVLVQLASSMRAHRRGGALLVVPEKTEAWRESILAPISYSVSPPYPELGTLMRADPAERTHWRWQTAVGRAVDLIAGLTAVDGATIISDNFELLAFGAKIRRREGSSPIDQVLVTEPVEGAPADMHQPEQLGGTRHRSAAQFVYDQRDALALVASQDGRFTRFAWSPAADMVHAERLELLLL